MPKRTIAVVYYATAEGRTYPRGTEVELSDAEAARGDKLRAFAENYGDKPKSPEPPQVKEVKEEEPKPEADEPKAEEPPKEEQPKPKPRRKRSS